MTSRDRVFRAIAHKTVDRPPVDGWFGPGAWRKLKQYLGITDDEELRRRLGLDFRQVIMEPAPDFKKKADFFPLNAVGLVEASYIVQSIGNNLFEDEWGVRIGLDEDGANWHYAYHPLSGQLSSGRQDITAPVPDLSAPGRFDKAAAEARRWKEDYAICAGVSTLFRQAWLLCGFSEFLEALLTNRAGVERLLDQLFEYFLKQTRAYIEAGADIIQLLGDLGSQSSMFMSPALWRSIFKPRMKALIDATKRYGVRFFLHSDGSIEAIIPDLIEIGIDMLNPIQPECTDPLDIKRKYGDHLVLHGTISLQRTLTMGTPEEVRAEVQKRVEECGQDGGLILAPSNVVTDDVPVENIVALYDSVQEMAE
ncbi:MAG: uroporphyrinogen decarboxylase family protein [Bacillota bacterium]